jgi:hypothetical protein
VLAGLLALSLIGNCLLGSYFCRTAKMVGAALAARRLFGGGRGPGNPGTTLESQLASSEDASPLTPPPVAFSDGLSSEHIYDNPGTGSDWTGSVFSENEFD